MLGTLNLKTTLLSDARISYSHVVPLGNVTQEPRPNAKRPRESGFSNESSPVSKRVKGEALQPSPNAKARRMVEGYDEELSCPLCGFCSSAHAIKLTSYPDA